MTYANRPPDLGAPDAAWIDYLTWLLPEDLIHRRKLVHQFSVENPNQAPFVARILALIDAEIILRFPGLVDRVKFLEGAVFLRERESANLAKEVA